MHPVTHLLAGWVFADELKLKPRDRAIVAWSCVVPDLDGLGYAGDLFNKLAGRVETTYYELYHHNWGHGLPAGLVIGLTVFALTAEKRKTALLAFLAFHLHLIMDLAGSRGSDPIDIWSIHYLAPVSESLTIIWNNQWPLTSWQNTTLTIILMLICIITAIQRGYSPVILFSKRADTGFIEVLRNRFKV